MKKIIALLVCIIFVVTLCSCSEQKNIGTESLSSTKYDSLNGYEYGDYEIYNSNKNDNDLENKKIYIKGTVKAVFDTGGICSLSVVTENSDRWLIVYEDVSYNSNVGNLFNGKKIICFGRYQCYSDIFLMPVISIDKIKINGKTYTSDDIVDETTAQLTTEAPTKKGTETPKSEPVAKNSDNKSDEQVIFNNKGVKIVYKGKKKDNYSTYFKLYIENNSNTDFTFQLRDVSVNGYMVHPVFSCDVKNGKKANDSFKIYNDDLEENGITEIETIDLSIRAINWDDNSNDFNSKMITFNP